MNIKGLSLDIFMGVALVLTISPIVYILLPPQMEIIFDFPLSQLEILWEYISTELRHQADTLWYSLVGLIMMAIAVILQTS